MSRVLVITTSLRARSNSDRLAEELIAGAKDLVVSFPCCAPPYHSEFSENFLLVVLAMISSTTLMMELNRPIAVA